MAQPVTQGQAIRSEWIKLRSVRSSWFMLAVTALSIVGIGLLVSYVNHVHWSTMSASDRAEIDPVNQSLIGVNLAQLIVGGLGVLVAAGEYGTGMIRVTFAAVPRRFPVLAAKAAVLGAATFVVCLVAVLIAVTGGAAMSDGHRIALGSPETAQVVLGAALYLTVVGVMGVGLGFLIRSTAGGIATLLGVLLVLPLMVAALPGRLIASVVRYLPSTAGRALFTMNGGDMLPPWSGFGIFLVYALVVLAAAAAMVRRRDV